MAHHRDWPTWAGVGIVGAAAAVMSFTALSDLAVRLGVTSRMDWPWADGATTGGIPVAYLLPLTIDVLAAVATRVWLQGRTNAAALVYARRAAWAAIVATVVGNGAHGYLISAPTGEPWIASVAVAALPALALGAVLHLAHLVGRGVDVPGEAQPADPWLRMLDEILAEPWDQAILGWAKAVDTEGVRVPTNADPDDVLVADLRVTNFARPRPLVQDEIRKRYGVGQRRAARVRDLAQQPPAAESTSQDEPAADLVAS